MWDIPLNHLLRKFLSASLSLSFWLIQTTERRFFQSPAWLLAFRGQTNKKAWGLSNHYVHFYLLPLFCTDPNFQLGLLSLSLETLNLSQFGNLNHSLDGGRANAQLQEWGRNVTVCQHLKEIFQSAFIALLSDRFPEVIIKVNSGVFWRVHGIKI